MIYVAKERYSFGIIDVRALFGTKLFDDTVHMNAKPIWMFEKDRITFSMNGSGWFNLYNPGEITDLYVINIMHSAMFHENVEWK